jgi:hypothetical protein
MPTVYHGDVLAALLTSSTTVYPHGIPRADLDQLRVHQVNLARHQNGRIVAG